MDCSEIKWGTIHGKKHLFHSSSSLPTLNVTIQADLPQWILTNLGDRILRLILLFCLFVFALAVRPRKWQVTTIGSMIKSSAATGTTKFVPITLTLDHSRLLQTNAESIRIFLRKYDQYAYVVTSRARQLDGGWATSYNSLSDQQVREFLEGRAKESIEVVTLEKLGEIVKCDLHTNIKDTSATTRI